MLKINNVKYFGNDHMHLSIMIEPYYIVYVKERLNNLPKKFVIKDIKQENYNIYSFNIRHNNYDIKTTDFYEEINDFLVTIKQEYKEYTITKEWGKL